MAAGDATPQSVADAKPDLNTASQKELMKTEQIGEKLAERIQSNAPFSNWEEVGKVKGIGPTRLKNLHRRFRIDIAKQSCAPSETAAPSGDVTQVNHLAAAAAAVGAAAERQSVIITCNRSFHRAPVIIVGDSTFGKGPLHVSIQGK